MLESQETVLTNFVNGIDQGASGTLTSGFLLNMALGFSLNMIWSCLNVLQLMVKLPLLKILYPATANLFNDPMIGIATFDFLDYLDLQRRLMFFPNVGALNPQLELSGYDSAYFSLSLGTIFFIVVIYLGVLVVGAITCVALHLTKV